MGRRKRRQFTKEFKTRVALEALKEMSTLVELAAKYDVHPNQISQWKREAKESLPEVFGSRKAADDAAHEEEVSRLYEEIGRLKVELDWLKKSHTSSASARRALIEPDPQISIRRQCELLGVSRSSYYYEPATESELNLELMRRIDELYLKRPFYGSRRMTAQLIREGYQVNRKRRPCPQTRKTFCADVQPRVRSTIHEGLSHTPYAVPVG